MAKVPTKPSHNPLCVSCRRPCKQSANAIVSKCPRYCPFSSKARKVEFEWKQINLPLCPAGGPPESPAKGPAKTPRKRKPAKQSQ
jgi:hypothetical protein